jgi:anti-sigma B factor antagonist
MGLDRIVRIVGDIDTVSAPELECTLSSLRTENVQTYYIDMQYVGYISSMGLRVFLSHLKKTQASGSRMVLAGCNQLVLEVFHIAGFTPYFEMIDNLDGALAELG